MGALADAVVFPSASPTVYSSIQKLPINTYKIGGDTVGKLKQWVQG
jgi:hypothetical protein